jgi:molybdate transport system substrate-binding protein
MRRLIAVVLVLAGLGLGGCGKPASDGPKSVHVWAATSLTRVLQAIEPGFERAHPGVDLVFTFGDDAALARRIVSGAPADVFAAASAATMAQVKNVQPQLIARDKLVIAVGPANPLHVKSLADLARQKVAICSPQIGIGAATRDALTKAGVTLTAATEAPDAKAALTALTLGEVDAALIYRSTTLAASGQVDMVEFPGDAETVTDILAAALPSAEDTAAATAFVDYLKSTRVRQTVEDSGFMLP